MMRRLISLAFAAALLVASPGSGFAQDRAVFDAVLSVRPVVLEKPATFDTLEGQPRESGEALLIAVSVTDIVPFLPSGSKIPAVSVNGAFAEVLYGPYIDGRLTLLAPAVAAGPGAPLELTFFADGETARSLARARDGQRKAIEALIERAPRLQADIRPGQPVRATDLPELRLEVQRGGGRINR